MKKFIGGAMVLSVLLGAGLSLAQMTGPMLPGPHNPASSGTVYADWSGIDAMSVPTSYYGDTSGNAIRIGSSNWQWQRGNSNHTTSLTVTDNAHESLCPSGHNCIVLQYSTADGTNGFPNYIYLSPTYSSWSGDPTQTNGGQSSGGVWWEMYFRANSDTEAYVNNTGAQIKGFLNREDNGGNYMQANGCSGCGEFLMPGFGATFENGDYLNIRNGSDAGGIINRATTSVTSGTLLKCQMRRDTANTLGHLVCTQDGVERVNTEVHGSSNEGAPEGYNCTTHCKGCNQYGSECFGGSAGLGTNLTGVVMGFQPGIRYFAACSNSCANTTLKVVLSQIKACNYNCTGQ